MDKNITQLQNIIIIVWFIDDLSCLNNLLAVENDLYDFILWHSRCRIHAQKLREQKKCQRNIILCKVRVINFVKAKKRVRNPPTFSALLRDPCFYRRDIFLHGTLLIYNLIRGQKILDWKTSALLTVDRLCAHLKCWGGGGE